MSWLDIIILIPLLIGLVMGLVRGLLIEVVSIAAIGIGYICSKIFSAVVASWLMTSFNWNEAVCSVVAYAVIFIIVALGLILLA